MASTFSTNLKIELQTTGENSGTWGTITNTNLGTALEQAIVGYGNPSYASDANLTLTYTDTNAAQTARALVLNVTSAVSLTGTRELVVPTIQKQYIVQNNTTGSQSITVKTSGGTGVTVPNGRKAHLYVNGTDVIYMDDYVDINGGAIDGTPIGANSASTGAFTTLAASGNVTLSGGTANGVLYLNGSKVATSGSGMVFDGTRFFVGTTTTSTSSTQSGEIYSTGAVGFMLTNTTAANFPISIKNEGSSGTRNLIRFYEGPAGGTVRASVSLDGSNYLTFDTNNFIINTGNLGIGTASPAYRLHVVGGAAIANRTTSDTPGNISLGVLSTASVATFGWRTDTSNNLHFDIYNGASWSAALTTSLSGNLGLGVTPSAFTSTIKALQIGSTSVFRAGDSGFTQATIVASNARQESAVNYYIANGFATDYTQQSGAHIWYNAPSGTAGNAISFTQAMTLTSGALLQVAYPGNTSFYAQLDASDGNGHVRAPVSGMALVFDVSGSERARIDSSGNLGLGVTPSAWGGGLNGTGLQVGAYTSITSANAFGAGYGFNFYYDGTNYRYVASNFASLIEQSGGAFRFKTAASGTAGNAISFTQAMTLDASGNLGIGTTSPSYKLDVTTGGVVATPVRISGNDQANVRMRLDNSGSGGRTWELVGGLPGANNANFSIRDVTGSTTPLTIDSSGNLGLAQGNGPTQVLSLYRAGSTNALMSAGNSNTGLDGTWFGVDTAGNGIVNVRGAFPLLFSTSANERGRFTAGGYFKASDTGTYRNAAGVYHELRNSDGSNPTVFVTNSNASTPYGIAVEFTAAAPDNNTQFFFRAEDTGAVRCYIWADGDLANHDGVYGTISDERLKQDIVDASSQWDDLKAIRFRKYRMKTDVEANPDAPAMFGVVAQELAQVCPGLVDEHPNMKKVEVTDEEGNVTQTQEPDGTTTMTVKSSILLMKAAKALQEAMARIESLEADMAALKGAK
jgi:hypothetical protein